MKIEAVRARDEGDERVISARIGDFELWFRLPAGYGRTDVADPFVAAALLPAMRLGEDVELAADTSLSAALADGLDQLQEIYRMWFPRLSRITVDGRVTPTPPHRAERATFFSAGVDSLYTYYRKRETLSRLVFLIGIDMQVDNESLAAETVRRNREFAEAEGKTLVVVASNIRELGYRHDFSWAHHYCAGGLGAIALLLGFETMLVPASQPAVDLYPDGSSPVIDPLYTSEATRIIYEGPAIRYRKMRYLADYPEALALLRVCWQDRGYNCGECEKCLRTMLIARMFDIDIPTLPKLDDLGRLRGWRIITETQANIFLNLKRAAQESGKRDVQRYLRYIELRERLRRRLSELDRRLLGGVLKSAYRRLRPAG